MAYSWGPGQMKKYYTNILIVCLFLSNYVHTQC